MFTTRPPVHKHDDCSECEYVWGFDDSDGRLYDIYVHRVSENETYVIVRYGPDGDYYSTVFNPAEVKGGAHLDIVRALSSLAFALRSAGAPLRDVDRSQ